MDRTDIFDTMQSDDNLIDMRSTDLPEPPAGMDTPNMRKAIAWGLLAADNRLGHADRPVFRN
jgi:hypothetical protein